MACRGYSLFLHGVSSVLESWTLRLCSTVGFTVVAASFISCCLSWFVRDCSESY